MSQSLPRSPIPSTEEDKPLIEIRNLTRRYGKTVAVDNVSFKIRNGHICGLVGADGAGKSTVMNLMTGCISPTSGSVLVGGYDIGKNPKEAKRQIGYLPAHCPLFEDMTPTEYLTFIAETKGVKDEVLDRQVREILARTGLSEVKHILMRNLPAHKRLSVGLAQTLLGNPDTIILDEPLEGLDPLHLSEMRTLIRKLGEKLTVVVSARMPADLGGMCDHVIVLSEGRVVSDEDVEPTPEEPVPNPEDAEAEESPLAEAEPIAEDELIVPDSSDDQPNEEVTA